MNIVGVDIGGTFTDLVGCVDGRIVTSKTSTVPADPTRGIAESLKLADCKVPALSELLHGSTIAINTVLERKGARTALITTRGFRDTYAIGRGNRVVGVQSVLPSAEAADPARADLRGHRADDRQGRGADAAQ